MGEAHDMARALGLVVNDTPRKVDLQDGVVLIMRPAEGVDWSAAGGKVAKVMAADHVAGEGRKRYGLSSPRDSAAMMNPDTWEGVAEFCTAVEVAARIVTEVYRQVGPERRSVEPTIETFRQLFRIGDNLELFLDEARRSGRELITAKKE